MAKKTITVHKERLAKAINEAESNGPLKNQSELFKKVAEIYDEDKVTYSVIGLRIKEWNIKVKTPKGHKGAGTMSEEQKTAMLAARGNRKTKAEKFEKSDMAQKALSELESAVPERFQPLVESIKKGSRSSAVKLKCLECSVYQTREVKLCECYSCPLWLFRPYQGALDEDEVNQEAIEEVEGE